MKARDIGDLVLLAALWGAAFLFMRVAAPQFGAVALAALRVAGAALLLVPLLVAHHRLGALRRHWRPIALVGIANSALPFMCFAYAALSLTAGLASIINATRPLFGALIAMAWLRESSSPARVAGLLLGFVGVLALVWDRVGIKADVDSLAVATGSQVSAALVLALPAWLAWPATPPSLLNWLAVLALALFCTGLAYLLYFRLIARVGSANALAVTYLVPAFALLWGYMFLGEAVSPGMLAGCALILAGTSLATGLLKPRRSATAQS